MILTVRQASDALGVNPQRVRALIGDGRLKATRFEERAWMIDSEALEAVRVRPTGRPKTATTPFRVDFDGRVR